MPNSRTQACPGVTGTRPLERFVALKESGGALLLATLGLIFYLVRSPDDDFGLTNVIAIPIIFGYGLVWYGQYHGLQRLVQDMKDGAVTYAQGRYRALSARADALCGQTHGLFVLDPRRRREQHRVGLLLDDARLEAEQTLIIAQQVRKTMAARWLQYGVFTASAIVALVGAVPALLGH